MKRVGFFAMFIKSYIKDSSLIKEVGPLVYDLDDFGAFISTKKTFTLTDSNGDVYKVTVEEA
jgi:hypothetical protein